MNMTHDCATMKARVLEVCPCHLMVCDVCSHQTVRVNTEKAGCFSVGDCLCIHYSGAMTMSIPPQITAENIHKV